MRPRFNKRGNVRRRLITATIDRSFNEAALQEARKYWHSVHAITLDKPSFNEAALQEARKWLLPVPHLPLPR